MPTFLNIRNIKTIFFFLAVSISLKGQSLIDMGDKNPLLKGPQLIRQVNTYGDQLYIGGRINFVGDKLVPPILRINSDGSIDESFNSSLNYSVELANNLGSSSTVLNDNLYVFYQGGILKINADGSNDDSFQISGYPASFITYRDSILVVSDERNLLMYGEDGNSRKIELGFSNDISLKEVILLADNQVLLRILNIARGIFEYILLKDNFTQDNSFENFTVNYPFYINNIELLPSGKILIAGHNELSVNSQQGNGIFILDDTGAIDANSFHQSDISFIDPYGDGVEFTLPLSDGKFLLVGYTFSNEGHKKRSLVRLLSTGERDGSFTTKNLIIDKTYGSFFMFRSTDDNVFIVGNQVSYDGKKSTGINKINSDGENIDEFSIDLYGTSNIYSFDNYDDDNFLITGSFIESKTSNTPFISGFSLNPNSEFPWKSSAILESDDIIGATKVLSNGDLIIGSYDRNANSLLKIYGPEGNQVSLSSNHPSKVSGEKSIHNIHESENFIYVTGVFKYNSDGLLKRSILKMNKDYSIVSSYSPISEILNYDPIIFSHLTNADKLIAHHVSYGSQSSKIIRLKSNGEKDNTFNDIFFNDLSSVTPKVFIVNDSLILIHERPINSTRTVKKYDIDGNLLNDDFVSIEKYSEISHILQISDTVVLVSGSFSSINGINRDGLALLNLNGIVYEDIDFDITGRVDDIAIYNDTLFVLGPGAINGINGGGFYAISLLPDAPNIEFITNSLNGSIDIGWTENLFLRNIEIIRIDPEGNEVSLANLERGYTYFEDDDIAFNTVYTYKLIGKNIFGENTSSISYEIIQPSAPDNLEARLFDEDVLLEWADNSDNEIGYSVYRSVDDGDYEKIIELPINAVSYNDEAVPINHEYSYFVEAKSANYKSEPSNEVNINVITSVVFDGDSINSRTQVYPNPSSGKIKIILDNPQVSTITISNIKGQLVRTINVNNSKVIEISNLSFGAYVLKLSDASGVIENRKIIVK